MQFPTELSNQTRISMNHINCGRSFWKQAFHLERWLNSSLTCISHTKVCVTVVSASNRCWFEDCGLMHIQPMISNAWTYMKYCHINLSEHLNPVLESRWKKPSQAHHSNYSFHPLDEILDFSYDSNE